MSDPATDPLDRLCIHTITTKPWSLETAVEKYLLSGIRGISVWRQYLEDRTLQESSYLFENAGLQVVSLVRGGFFTATTKKERQSAITENKKAIEEASMIGGGLLVLVCGATPGQSLEVSRDQIRESIEYLLPFAEDHKVKLAVEPLHPVYADTRSAINTLEQANSLVESFNSQWLGVALDIYHLWWDPNLETEIIRCGKNDNLLAVHLCDWRVPTRDILNDRELPGQGILDIPSFIGLVEKAGFKGFYEIEIFSDQYWSMDQDQFLELIINSYINLNI